MSSQISSQGSSKSSTKESKSSSNGTTSPKAPKTGGFLRRNNLKLPAALGTSSNKKGTGSKAEEGSGTEITDDGRSAASNSPKNSTSIESLPLSDLFLSSKDSKDAPSTTTSTFSLSPSISRESSAGGPHSVTYSTNSDRRGSLVSNYSLSHSAASHGPGPSASYLNYHRASLSSFASSTGSPRATASSNGTTVGDLSTASMPLISGAHGSSRTRASGSVVSLSDSSSVHSYPPKPRTRTPSDVSGKPRSGSIEWKSWSGFNAARRDSQTSHSSSQLPPPQIALTRPPNPFAPLRKRLTRTIGTGKRVAVDEVQLIFELVDALESYQRSIEAAVVGTPQPSCSTDPLGGDPTNIYLSEVLSLIQELSELAPEVQRCLAQGSYGSLASTPPRAPPMNDLISALRAPNWWPRRLARDCRGLLEEVGFPPAVTRAPSSQGSVLLLSSALALVQGNGSAVGAESEILGGLGKGKAPEISDERRSSKGSDWDLASLASNPFTDGKARSVDSRQEEMQVYSAKRAARQVELLNEGKRRWAAYRQRQQSITDLSESPLVEEK